MKIRKFKKEDAKEVSALICETFKQCIAVNFTKTAIRKFMLDHTPEKQVVKAATRDVFVLTIDNKIVGVIEGAGNNRITKLFVKGNYQGKGFAKRLLNKIEKLYKQRGSDKILIRSSLNAEGFYERMGYKKSTGVVESNGLMHQPMKKYL